MTQLAPKVNNSTNLGELDVCADGVNVDTLDEGTGSRSPQRASSVLF